MNSVAQASESVKTAAPEMTQQAYYGERQLVGIATDVHTVTTRIVVPKSFFGKVWEGVKTLGGLARFIP